MSCGCGLLEFGLGVSILTFINKYANIMSSTITRNNV